MLAHSIPNVYKILEKPNLALKKMRGPSILIPGAQMTLEIFSLFRYVIELLKLVEIFFKDLCYFDLER